MQTDASIENSQLWVHEYCRITPEGEAPFYAYRQVKLIIYTWTPYGYTYDSFTTPDSNRYVGSTHYETQSFRITKTAIWDCETNNCAARYYIQGILSEDHAFNHGTCTFCATPPYYCDTYFDEDVVELPQNTTYNMSVGADCIVNGRWESE